MRKLLTALLVLPFLMGANGGTAMHGPGPRDASFVVASGTTTHALSAPVRAAPQPPLPGHLVSTGATAGPALLDGPDTGRWRTRAGGHTADPLRLRHDACCAALRTYLLRNRPLDLRLELARSGTAQPFTYSNPPPASPT